MEEDATQSPAPYLPDDVVVEILRRLPAKSLCRSRCVSKSWSALLSDPARRHMFAHTASSACFFFRRYRDDNNPCRLGFVTAEGDGGPPPGDTAFSFLPASSRGEVTLLDSCNGLLLLRCSSPTATGGECATAAPPPPAFYVVCNPATREWVALPQPSLEPGFDDFYTKACSAALGFDPSDSPHFHVFQLEEEVRSYDHFVSAVEIYSSETGTWVRKETAGWRSRPHQCLFLTGHMTYLNGFLHLTTWEDVIAVVDTRGEAWRTIDAPCSMGSRGTGFVSHSQGRLVYVHVSTRRAGTGGELLIYVLEERSSERWWWSRKHKVSNAYLFGPGKLPSYGLQLHENPVVAFHSACKRFYFYDRSGERFMCYDMNRRRVSAIGTLEDVVSSFDDMNPFFL